MASYKYNGIDRLEIDLETLAKLDDDTVWSLLNAGAEVIRRFHTERIRKAFKQHTGELAKSPSIHKKINADGLYALIYPEGTHGQFLRRKKTRTYKNSRHGRTYTVGGKAQKKTNAEIAFILEYGSPRIDATHWMENANEAANDEMMDAMAAVWDEHLKSLNL